jgi:hypothetical protein
MLLLFLLIFLGGFFPGGAHTLNTIPVQADLFTELEELSRLVDIAYCVAPPPLGIHKPFTCLSRCVDFPQFHLVTTWNTGALLSDSCGYIALDHAQERIIVAFRGTYSLTNTIVDLSTLPQPYLPYRGFDSAECANCTVHTGFHSSWLHTRARIWPELQAQLFVYPHYTLHLLGHSLGGAVAALAGLDLLANAYRPVLTTFGEPRVGNQGLVRYIDQRFNLSDGSSPHQRRYRRVTHVDDPVPLLPLEEWGYRMHAGEIFISKPALSPDLADLEHCDGDHDPRCISAQEATLRTTPSRGLFDLVHSPYKLWQLLFAHRDYFWRLGLCVPGGDPSHFVHHDL